jgi:hypothetical protein
MNPEPRLPHNVSPPRPSAAPGEALPIHHDVAYDHTDVDPGSVLKFLSYLGLSLAFTFLIVWGVLRLIESRTARFDAPPSPLRQGVQKDLPPEPRLQGVVGHESDPQQDLRDMRSDTDKTLNSYGWVDESNGIARIPIKEAMKLVAEKQLSPQPTAPSARPATRK